MKITIENKIGKRKLLTECESGVYEVRYASSSSKSDIIVWNFGKKWALFLGEDNIDFTMNPENYEVLRKIDEIIIK